MYAQTYKMSAQSLIKLENEKRIYLNNVVNFIAVVFVLAALITHFILLIIKEDHIYWIHYRDVALPAIIVYAVGIIFFGVKSIYTLTFSIYRSLVFIGLTILLIGSLWSQLLLVRRFDHESKISMGKALSPFLTLAFIGALIIIVGITIKLGETKRSIKDLNKRKG